MPTDWNPATVLAWWAGPPTRDLLRPQHDLPEALLDLYEALSGYPAFAMQNTLRGPDEVERDGGMLVFWVENQQVSSWATDGDEVFELTDGSDTWVPTGHDLGAFTVALLLFEIAVASEHVAVAEVAEDDLDFALQPFADVPVDGPLVDSALFATDDAVVFASDGWLCLAAKTAAALARYEQRL